MRYATFVAAAILAVAGVLAVKPLRQRAHDIAANLKLIRADTGDVMASATYQRFAVRREAVASMKTDLLSLAAAESALVADSGRPTTNPLPSYWSPKNRNNYAWIRIERDRWVAKMTNLHTSMSCSITAMVDSRTLDSTTWRYHAGEPVCAEWTAAESAVAASAPVATNALVEPPPPTRAEPPHAERKHRDWGPVNNRPPSMPYIVKNACEGEGCARSGTWAACSDVAARREKRLDAPVVFTIHGGEKFTALTIDLHVEAPGVVVFRHAMSNPPGREGDQVESIAFTPSDTLYLLNSLGEGDWVWWFRGQLGQGYEFWRDIDRDQVTDTAVLVRRPKTIRWVRTRNAAGQEGWIVGDYQKMATGGYMDQIERCLHPARR